MSKVKAAGSTKNNHDSPGQRLGVKKFGGEAVKTGQIIVRQVGRTKVAGKGTFIAPNFTIHAAKDGTVVYRQRKIKHFTGKTLRRTEVTVE